MMPHSENPEPRESESEKPNMQASPLEDEEFHQLADEYLDEVVARIEELQESREELDLDYSVSQRGRPTIDYR